MPQPSGASGRPGAAAPGARPGASAAPAGGAIGSLNEKLKSLLPHGDVNSMRSYGNSGIDPRTVAEAYERLVAVPAEVLAKTFGLIRVRRTVIHADSIAYVFERRRDILGREVCRAFRITDHPDPTPAPRFDPKNPLVFPDRNPDLKPIVGYVDVSCNDPKMQPVEPGSLKTPAPRHP